jgi:hypothetical protein
MNAAGLQLACLGPPLAGGARLATIWWEAFTHVTENRNGYGKR